MINWARIWLDCCVVVGFKRKRERHLILGSSCMYMNSRKQGQDRQHVKMQPLMLESLLDFLAIVILFY